MKRLVIIVAGAALIASAATGANEHKEPQRIEQDVLKTDASKDRCDL